MNRDPSPALTTDSIRSNADSASFAQREEGPDVDVDRRVFLLPIDGSVHSKRALEWYARQIYRDGDAVYLAHIVDPPYEAVARTQGGVGEVATAGGKAYLRQLERRVRESRETEDSASRTLERCGVKDALRGFVQQVSSDPGRRLVETVQEHGITCVVMGSRGLGTLRRTFLGSVSDYVLHHAHVPVIIVPPAAGWADKHEQRYY